MIMLMWIFKNSGFFFLKETTAIYYTLWTLLVIYYVLGYYLLGNVLVAILNLTFGASVKPRKKEAFLNAIRCNQNSKHLKHIFHSLYVPETRPLLSI